MGQTSNGGTSFDGTVFSLSVGLKPFIRTVPTGAAVGASVEILGNGLTGATSVTFDGTPVTSFTVSKSGTSISTTVPVGATTGTVDVVVTANGKTKTLKSNVPFQVLP